MSMNVNALSSGMYCSFMDPEYQRIMRELRAMGIEPSGDKMADKAKLEAAKSAQKAENNQKIVFHPVEASNETDKNQAFSAADEAKNTIGASAIDMTGAQQIAQLNKLKLFGLN